MAMSTVMPMILGILAPGRGGDAGGRAIARRSGRSSRARGTAATVPAGLTDVTGLTTTLRFFADFERAAFFGAVRGAPFFNGADIFTFAGALRADRAVLLVAILLVAVLLVAMVLISFPIHGESLSILDRSVRFRKAAAFSTCTAFDFPAGTPIAAC